MNEMNKPSQRFSLRALCKSFAYAIEGIIYAARTQRNMCLHILAAMIVCVAGLWLNISGNDWRWLVLSIAFVWAAELVNTAFEYLCDVVRPEIHESVKRAKDIAAAAVLVSVIGAVLIGILTLWPYL